MAPIFKASFRFLSLLSYPYINFTSFVSLRANVREHPIKPQPISNTFLKGILYPPIKDLFR